MQVTLTARGITRPICAASYYTPFLYSSYIRDLLTPIDTVCRAMESVEVSEAVRQRRDTTERVHSHR